MILRVIREVIKSNWPILVIFLVTLCSIKFFYIQTHREKTYLYKEILSGFALIYLFLLFQLLTQVELNHGGGYNLVPFTEIMRYKFGSKLFIYNVIGNIVVFIPFGLIIAEYVKPKNIFPVFIISLIVSTTVEFVQLHIGRSFDVDDIMLNIVGAIIGYLLYVGISAIQKHLPKFFQSPWIYNVICVILLAIFVVYLLSILGVVSI